MARGATCRARRVAPSRRRTAAATVLLAILLAGCQSVVPAAAPAVAPAPSPAQARLLDLKPGPALSSLPLDEADAAAALAAFRASCPRLLAREDQSGLTRQQDWRQPCEAATGWTGPAVPFFASHLEAVEVGGGQAFVTGYFEPEIAGSPERLPGYDVPVHAPPPDLVRALPGDAEPLEGGRMPLGRYDGEGAFRPYWTRAEIEAGALSGQGLEIAWVADRAEFFFLQVQGSGRLRAPDGSVMRIGYAAQNGHAYTGIGRLMRDRGLIGDGPGQYPGSMQGIIRYIHEHPDEGRALMNGNASYVFFRKADGEEGPRGALGVPVSGGSSAAVDPRYVPLGAPVWLALDRAEASGLWVAQDIGGAIKGANRFDTFWGSGEAAGLVAGGMSARGRALLLLPKGTLARLGAP